MSHFKTWRTALILSAILHLMLLPGLASLSPKSLPNEAKNLIELELYDDTLPAPSQTIAPTAPLNQILAANNTTMPSAKYTPAQNTVAGETQSFATTSTTVAAIGNTSTYNTSAVPSSTQPYVNTTSQPAAPQSVILRPQILQKTELIYPEQARRDGLEGIVLLSVEILTNGQAGSISIAGSSGQQLLDEAAIHSLRQWRFVPAKDSVSGLAVECTITIPLAFKLN